MRLAKALEKDIAAESGPGFHTALGITTDYNHGSKLAEPHQSNYTGPEQEEPTQHQGISGPTAVDPRRSF